MKNDDGKLAWLGALLIMAYLAIAIGVMLLAMYVGGTAHAEYMGPVKLVQARGGLNVREAPGIHAKATYLLDDCTTVIVLEEADGWSRVAFNTPPHNEIGWVCSDYLN